MTFGTVVRAGEVRGVSWYVTLEAEGFSAWVETEHVGDRRARHKAERLARETAVARARREDPA